MLLFLSSLAGGQIIPLSNDTLRVVNVSAAPGDTGVRVDIYIRNTIPLGGWGIRFLYDSLVFTPRASGTSLIFEETSRQDTVPAIANGGSVPQPGVLNYTFAFDGSSCARDVPCPDTSFARHIGVGSGAVIRLIFDVSATAPVGNYNLTIQDDPGAPASFNLFSDTTGVSLYRPILTNGVFTVTTSGPGPGNDPPVIASIPNQSVTEGETLTFNVTATDPEGDNITLQAISLPPNATFPTVTGPSPVNGTFTFAPNLTQGPANLTATFRATDDSGEFTQRSVNIEVLDRPQDVLVVDSTSGGVPGKTEVLVPFILNNIQTVYGFQFDLEYNDSLITIDSFIVDTIRLAGFNVYTNLGDSAGFLTLVAFSLSADSIPTGNGPVLYAAVTIDSSALPGRTLLDIKNGREVISTNPNDPSNPLTTISGNFTIDPFGDLNLDLSVDVADAVNMVRYLLGLITLSARQLDVADVNLDTSIDVGDLVGIINLILGRPIDAPTQYATGLAQVELFYDQLQPGTLEDVELRADFKIAVAGVELVLDYNPSQVRVVAVNRTNRSSDLSLDYRVNNNKVKMLMYSFGGKSIIPGTGSILTIRLAVSPDLDPDEEVYLKISKLVLADTAAVVIPTGDQPVLPIDFKLEQNFPNPFNANTTIRFEIPFNQGGGEVRATLKIYNILGRKVKTLVDEALLPGRHQVIWDGRDDFGNQVASGMYFYRLTLPGYTESKKMTLLK
jgi:hypothetical protein